MTTETVSVQRVVEKTEEVTVCDECCREVDEEGATFEMADGGDVELHFCSECVYLFCDKEPPNRDMLLVEEWKKQSRHPGWNSYGKAIQHTGSGLKALTFGLLCIFALAIYRLDVELLYVAIPSLFTAIATLFHYWHVKRPEKVFESD